MGEEKENTYRPFEEFLKKNFKEKIEENQRKKYPKKMFFKKDKELKKEI